MILDTARIALANGDVQAAIDVQPGREILSAGPRRALSRTVVRDRIVGIGKDPLSIVLSNGARLSGSHALKVCKEIRDGMSRFTPMMEIEPGMTVLGEENGMPVKLRVMAIMFDFKCNVRFVRLDTDNQPFIAEGVLCRS